jgi:hypothetical protein
VLDQFGISASFAKRWDGKMKAASGLKAMPAIDKMKDTP